MAKQQTKHEAPIQQTKHEAPMFIDCPHCGGAASRVDDMTGKPVEPLTYFCEECDQDVEPKI